MLKVFKPVEGKSVKKGISYSNFFTTFLYEESFLGK